MEKSCRTNRISVKRCPFVRFTLHLCCFTCFSLFPIRRDYHGGRDRPIAFRLAFSEIDSRKSFSPNDHADDRRNRCFGALDEIAVRSLLCEYAIKRKGKRH